mgnify:CR=1 FL=1
MSTKQTDISTLTDWCYEYESLFNSNDTELVDAGYILPFHDVQFVDFIMCRWVEIQDKNIDQIQRTTDDPFDMALAIANRGFTLAEYKLAVSGKTPPESYQNFRVFDSLLIIDKDADNYFNATQTKNDEQTLLETFLQAIEKAVKSEIPLLNEFFFGSTIKKYFPLSSLKRHTYILGRSGSGKSELMKWLFFQLQKTSQDKRNKSLVLLEPHGDLAKQILQFSLNDGIGKNRVVYLDPFLRETAKQILGEDILGADYTFVLNPFDLQTNDNREINYMTQELSSAFFEILKSEATTQMEAVIQACIDTLLRMPTASIADLKRFMDDKTNRDLVAQGVKNPNIERRNLMHRFDDTKLNSTKSGIYYRLQSLIDDMELRRLLVGKSTVNLEKEMNSGKVIILNLSKGLMGKSSAPALGKLFIALIQGVARKRQLIDVKYRKPTFLFIDEMQNYVTDTIEEIMAESRKYGLHLVLANQLLGQNMESKLKRIILSNTAIKIAGDNEEESLKLMAKQMGGLKTQDFDKLPKYSFYVYDNTRKKAGANVVKSPSALVDVKPPFYMDKKALREFFLWLANDSGYYIKLDETHRKPLKEADSQGIDPQNAEGIYKPNFND